MSLDPLNIKSCLSYPSSSLFVFDTVTSTNQVAWDLLAEGHSFPLMAIAAQQTAGRGQWGRTWVSSLGGLYLSVGLTLNLPADNAPHLTLFTAWGIAQSLRQYGLPISLKWPNDLILEGGKLGGIKSETRIQQETITHSVVGVGINWSNAVPHPGITIQSYPDSHNIDSLETLAAVTINGIFQGYEVYQQEGIDVLLRNYVEILESVGRTVMIEGVRGTIIGVTAQGELKVTLQSSGSKTTLKLPPGTLSLGYG
ncbi:biotin--[acetyl-CoA-carboxylase] ligase [Crocosphaera sp.]|uniref:biotin--[acetyl-CoA-carboxylase] ligase n=1 Tax=Crocosphaera sp. TaxID=2729996 RepID=UPI003F258204|nr:biotin--[acetyl-CoA-carboxylase] ligase [Crocosphaera sp.]